jgi:dTDP-4-dehydrorhamnose reductase
LRILLLGADTPIGYSLRAFLAPLQRHELIQAPLESTRLRRSRQAKKLLKSADPGIILDARLISLIDRENDLQPEDLERTKWLGETSAKMGCRYFLLSSSRVFSGSLRRPYRESDAPDATDELGQIMMDTERHLSGLIESLFILRLGWVFSGRGPSAFNRLLDQLRAEEPILASDNRRDCPVHSAEVARVIAGIIDQIDVGAPARGLFHYGSEGDTGYFSFVEAVVAVASQFDALAGSTALLQEDFTTPVVNRTLDCGAIRHRFGIQRRPWRDFIERAIRRYIEIYCQEQIP